MARYIVRRLISLFVTLVLIGILTFIIMKAIPGGPFTRDKEIPEAILEQLNEKYHLNDPYLKQMFDYLIGVFTFNMGPSFSKAGMTVEQIVMTGFPVSARLGILASLFIVGLGIPVGIISALKQNEPLDYFVMFMATLGVTIPNFVVATVLIYVFAGLLNWLPTNGLSTPLHYIAPVIALGGYSLAFVSRLTRSSMLEVLRQDYIRTARANGIPEYRVIGKHAVKNALIPVITYLGPMVAAILTGSFVVERIFAIAGLGQHFVNSINSRDYTVIMGLTMFYAAFYIVMVFLVDILYAAIDPRIKLEN